jgi:4-hydroxy-tetrahydrodipicolinate reductase
MGKIEVISYGVGAVGGFIAKFLLEKEGIDMVGAIDVAKDKVGKDLGEVLGLERKVGVKISDNLEAVLSKVEADIAVHATSSFLKDTYPQIASIVENGVNVISTCEELSYPYVSEPKLAEKLDALAKKHDVTVLGTGINPGFLMDTLVITLTAACEKIEKIEATRIMNAGTRRLPFQKKIGAGLTVEEFQQKIEKKQITGHVGLEQSIAMIASALAWKLDKIVVESAEPVIAKKPVESKDIKVHAGKVAGLKQKAKGIMKNREAIVLDFQAYIGAEEEYDAITIKGVPNINQKIQPCVHGDIGTVAVIVNAIPKVINAPPGLFTMKDLPVPSASPEDMRKYVKTT